MAAIIASPVFFVIAALLLAKGEVEDFGDISGAGKFMGAIGAVELILSVGVWFGSRIMWFVAAVLHGLAVTALIVGLFTPYRDLYPFLSCLITPVIFTFLFLMLPPSRNWCGLP